MKRTLSSAVALALTSAVLSGCNAPAPTAPIAPASPPFDHITGDPVPPSRLEGVWRLAVQASPTRPEREITVIVYPREQGLPFNECYFGWLSPQDIDVISCYFQEIGPRDNQVLSESIAGKSYTHVLAYSNSSRRAFAFGKFIGGVFKGEIVINPLSHPYWPKYTQTFEMRLTSAGPGSGIVR